MWQIYGCWIKINGLDFKKNPLTISSLLPRISIHILLVFPQCLGPIMFMFFQCIFMEKLNNILLNFSPVLKDIKFSISFDYPIPLEFSINLVKISKIPMFFIRTKKL